MEKMRKLFLLITLIAFAITASYAQSKHDSIDVVLLGDSNTWLGGDDCSGEKGWSHWFMMKFAPASCRSYARSGATWTNTSVTKYNVVENVGKISNDNVVYNQINRLKEAVKNGEQKSPRLILISAGTNDAWFKDKRPQVFAKTVDVAFQDMSQYITSRSVSSILTLAESVRYGCEMLMQAFPDAQIILLTPMQSTAVDAALIRKAGDTIEMCGKRMGVNAIRMDERCSVYQVRERVAKSRTYDGTHTSVDGARRDGFVIANMVEGMLEY